MNFFPDFVGRALVAAAPPAARSVPQHPSVLRYYYQGYLYPCMAFRVVVYTERHTLAGDRYAVSTPILPHF